MRIALVVILVLAVLAVPVEAATYYLILQLVRTPYTKYVYMIYPTMEDCRDAAIAKQRDLDRIHWQNGGTGGSPWRTVCTRSP